MPSLVDFVEESNRIEGIVHRGATAAEITAHSDFLDLPRVTVPALERFVQAVAGAPLRKRQGMDVRVGRHFPPPGGAHVVSELRRLLDRTRGGVNGAPWSSYRLHVAYEGIHPFMDGNGRSGRVLWAWQMKQSGADPFALPFLHRFYYQSLDAAHAPGQIHPPEEA